MKFTRIPETTFKNIQLNAGMLVKRFNPDTQEIDGLMGATTGGVNFKAEPTFDDFGDDIDNCPKNTMELKKLTEWDVTLSGTFVTITAETAHSLVGAADISGGKIIPRKDVLLSDFEEIWWVGDYSDSNTGRNAGFCAVHMLNALNTGGFQIQSNDKGKGNFAFAYTGHVSIDAQDIVPFEIFIKEGTDLNVTVSPEDPDSVLFDTLVSDMQTNISISKGVISGTLKFIEGGIAQSGPLSGDGNFLALKFNADWDKFNSVKIGLEPSEGTGLVEIIDDPDKNSVGKVDNINQIFKVVAIGKDGDTFTNTYALTGLTLEAE